MNLTTVCEMPRRKLYHSRVKGTENKTNGSQTLVNITIKGTVITTSRISQYDIFVSSWQGSKNHFFAVLNIFTYQSILYDEMQYNMLHN